MDINEIKELAQIMKENDLSKIKIEEKDVKIVLEKGGSPAPVISPVPVPPMTCAQPSETVNGTQEVPKETDGLITIKSPMVGVFYSSPAPGEKVYVTVGEKVNKGDVLCIIEAMKLMNEITSECSGEITEVCVGNGQVVEYDQPLFRLRCE